MMPSHRFVLAGLAALAVTAASGTAGASYEEAIQAALASAGGKPVLIDFYTDW